MKTNIAVGLNPQNYLPPLPHVHNYCNRDVVIALDLSDVHFRNVTQLYSVYN